MKQGNTIKEWLGCGYLSQGSHGRLLGGGDTELIPEGWEGAPFRPQQVGIRGKSILGRRNSKCVGPEVGEEGNVAGVEKAKGREAEKGVGWIWPLPSRSQWFYSSALGSRWVLSRGVTWFDFSFETITLGKYAHEKMLNIISHYGNEN